MSFAVTWTDLEVIILSEVRQRKTNFICHHLYVAFKKNDAINLLTKQKQIHRHRKQAYSYQRRKEGGGLN